MAYEARVVGSATMGELAGLFERELAMCNLKPGELCTVVTDTAYNPVVPDAFVAAALAMGAEAYKVVLPYSFIPSRSLLPAWQDMDLLVYSTTHTLHSRPEMGKALEGGLRALMAVQPLDVLERLVADPGVIRRTKAGARLVEAARTIRISSDAGTELLMDKTGRSGVANYGAADEPGHLDFWGAGMVETAQLEGTLEGTLVLNTGEHRLSPRPLHRAASHHHLPRRARRKVRRWRRCLPDSESPRVVRRSPRAYGRAHFVGHG